MKKINYLLTLLAIFSIAVLGCTQTTANTRENKGAMMEKETSGAVSKEGDAMEKSGESMKKEVEIMKKDETMTDKQSYAGKFLTGTESTKYLEFNKADYEKALKEKKKILLYFYANWCPLCKAEQKHTFAAFNDINDQNLIGFRVNYRDSDTAPDEEALAKEFGVSYQHTKVILKDGQRVGKWPDSWDKQRYLDELRKV